ncbi:MAG TPA: helix-turn-helix domain-containing protein [Actinocatenispora sp.]
MSLTNPYGDLEITDPRALRALAHPVRLAILDRLQRYGPATATQLSSHVGATPSVVSWHLRHLATFELVADAEGGSRRERRWRAAARGFRFAQPADGAGRSAARTLRAEMMARYADLPGRWLASDEPRLPDEWDTLAGLSNTRVVVTPDELRAIEDAIEQVLAPYVRRKDEPDPPGARSVRMLRYVLPEADLEADAATDADAGAGAPSDADPPTDAAGDAPGDGAGRPDTGDDRRGTGRGRGGRR